jgi:hypothetical protein
MKKPLKISLIVFVSLMVVLLLFFSRNLIIDKSYCECEQNFSMQECPKEYVACYQIPYWYRFGFFEITIASLIISGIVYLFVKNKPNKEWKRFWITFFTLEFIIFLAGFLLTGLTGIIFPFLNSSLKERIDTGVSFLILGLGPSGLISLIAYERSKRRLNKKSKKNWVAWIILILGILIISFLMYLFFIRARLI